MSRSQDRKEVTMSNEEMERILNYLRDTGQLDAEWYKA